MEEILIYDRTNIEEWKKVFDVCSPQECADLFGKPIKDGAIIYYPKTYMSFINEQEKMVDFFTITKEEFLNFYSYLTEEEYEATRKDVLMRSGYWNAEALAEDEKIDGIIIGKIIQSIMMTEWLLNRK